MTAYDDHSTPASPQSPASASPVLPDPAAAPAIRRRGAPWWLFSLAAGLAVLAMGSCAAALGASGTSPDGADRAAAVPAATVTVTADPGGAPAPTVTVTESAVETATQTLTETVEGGPPAPGTAFGDGLHLVGVDIEPGVYRASGVDGCYWARLSSAAGDFESIIANNNVMSGDAIVEIAPTDVAFESSRCGSWTRAQ